MPRFLAALGACLGLAAVFAPVTAAAAPSISRFAFQDTAIYDSLSAECGFTVWRSVDLRGSDTIYDDGTERIHINVVNVVWANGHTLTDNNAFTITIHGDTQTTTGTVFNINIRGRGMILLDAGKIVFDSTGVVFVGGPHQSLAGRGPECAALAP